MRYFRMALVLGLVMLGSWVWGQDTIPQSNIPTLNRIAGEYDFWKLVFGIAAAVLAIWSFFGLNFFVKTKAEEWIVQKIAKEANLTVENLKSAIKEYAHIAELKKKKILVVSAAEGQQTLKKVLDGCGFSNFEWVSISGVTNIVLQNTDLLLLNDDLEKPLSRDQIESVFEKFKITVAYQYFGPKNDLPIAAYRTTYRGINLGLCNSADRLETGILSLLKII